MPVGEHGAAERAGEAVVRPVHDVQPPLTAEEYELVERLTVGYPPLRRALRVSLLRELE